MNNEANAWEEEELAKCWQGIGCEINVYTVFCIEYLCHLWEKYNNKWSWLVDKMFASFDYFFVWNLL